MDASLAAEIADDRVADMQPDARHAERRHAFGHVDAKLLARFIHGERGGGCFGSVIGAAERGAPKGNDGVADKFVDRPAMVEHDVGEAVEIFVEQPRHGFRRDGVAELGEPLEVGEDAEDVAPFAVERQLVGIAHDLGGNVGGQIFAERRLGKGALARPDGACCGPHRRVTEQPADRPAKGREGGGIDAAALQPEGKSDEESHLPQKGERDPARAQVDQAGQPAREHDQDRQNPKRSTGERPRPRVVELLRQHMRVDLQPDHRLVLAGDRIGKAAERRVELIVVDDVATDQDVAILHQLRKARAHVGVHRHREGVDRNIGKNRLFLSRRGARGDEEANIALEIAESGIDRRHGV